jgi:Cys-tRNA(Pro)/Cys-tRNA(Cys) deacylase
MSTRAIQTLKKAQVPFEVITYTHKEKGAAFASQAIGFPLEKTLKTLIAGLGGQQYMAALLPGDTQLDLKKLAKVFHAKHTSMASTAIAERLTGYFVGGISPFGLKQPLESVMDSSIMNHQAVIINGGRRGVMLKMAPGDILHVLKCTTADIGRQVTGPRETDTAYIM